MGIKLLWTGVTWIFALIPMLEIVGLQGSKDIVLVGAVLMVIGCFLMWLDK